MAIPSVKRLLNKFPSKSSNKISMNPGDSVGEVVSGLRTLIQNDKMDDTNRAQIMQNLVTNLDSGQDDMGVEVNHLIDYLKASDMDTKMSSTKHRNQLAMVLDKIADRTMDVKTNQVLNELNKTMEQAVITQNELAENVADQTASDKSLKESLLDSLPSIGGGGIGQGAMGFGMQAMGLGGIDQAFGLSGKLGGFMGKQGGLLKGGGLKALPAVLKNLVGPAMAMKMAYDSIKGFDAKKAETLYGKGEGGFLGKLGSAMTSMVSGLTMGLVDEKLIANLGKKIGVTLYDSVYGSLEEEAEKGRAEGEKRLQGVGIEKTEFDKNIDAMLSMSPDELTRHLELTNETLRNKYIEALAKIETDRRSIDPVVFNDVQEKVRSERIATENAGKESTDGKGNTVLVGGGAQKDNSSGRRLGNDDVELTIINSNKLG